MFKNDSSNNGLITVSDVLRGVIAFLMLVLSILGYLLVDYAKRVNEQLSKIDIIIISDAQQDKDIQYLQKEIERIEKSNAKKPMTSLEHETKSPMLNSRTYYVRDNLQKNTLS